MPIGYVHTLGDSTLDNLYWMLGKAEGDVQKAKSNSVEGSLQKRINAEKLDNYEVVSHAYDGFTTKSVLHGDRIGAVLPRSGHKVAYMTDKAPDETLQTGVYQVKPLEKLKAKIALDPDALHYVVISVGGNDFRENLTRPWRLIMDIPQIQKRYLQIVDQVKGLQGRNIKPILMLQYRTDAKNDPYLIYPVFTVIGVVAVAAHLIGLALLTAPIWVIAGKISALAGGLAFLSGAGGLHVIQKIVPLSVTKDVFSGKKIGMVMLGALMRAFYQPILEEARKASLPILDLPNTFHPHRDLYLSGIEPGEEGGRLIAEGIHHIMQHHNYADESCLYSKSNGKHRYSRAANRNPAAWQVAYPA